MPEGSSIMLCSGIADGAYVEKYSGGAGLCGAVNAMGRNLAVELAPRGIRVNVLSPGLVIPTAIESNMELEESAHFLQRTLAIVPMARHGEPEDLADAALFMATCSYLSGQIIEVDGGWTAT
jgi:NAD(P)-dependent dehydrogenase (short-subunit alcohol dehydrogenase family)